MVTFLETEEYLDWRQLQSAKMRAQIAARLVTLREFGHYGNVRKLSSLLFELKFNNGNRIHCTERSIGGGENGHSNFGRK